MVVSESWEGYTNRDGSGLYFDIVRAIYTPKGYQVKIKIVPYSRSLSMVEKKEADFWLGSYINEEKYALYPKQHFDYDIVTAMYKKNRFKTFNSSKDMSERNVGWIRDYAIDEYIDVKVNVHERNDRETLLLNLQKDRIDFYLDDIEDMRIAIKKIGFETQEYNFVEVYRFKLYPAFIKSEKGELLVEEWNKTFDALLKNGTLKKLYSKYGKLYYYQLLVQDKASE